ncbi:ABC transporter ATP-binding protein [Paenibacillus sp. EC2-1]|uniref:ABC transporter ATP-binding protein n=1 Tax=Paenibacillus sp. EC2-1 TaxID=3388665 RepID=UPI003BEF004E
MQPIISFQDFSFRYKNQTEPTLRDITLDIYPGEKIWIAGPSGSGKSTLAHCLNGLIPFMYDGEINGSLTVGGTDYKEGGVFGRSRTVGTILQDSDAQFVGLTVGEDTAFVMENREMPRPQMKSAVISSLQMVDMLDRIEDSPHDLSGGQKQSVSLAGVLSTDSEVLLFDEPLANLDPAAGKRAMKLIESIRQNSGKTVIIIEHRVEDVLLEPVDRIVLLHKGSIVSIGTPDELLASGTLRQYGLRPPLYVDAMEYAGISIEGISNLAVPRKLDIDGAQDKLENFTNSARTLRKDTEREVLLSLRHIGFGYEAGRSVLEDVNLDIGAGETVALLGANGAGKSTLSNVITGLLKPRSGEILLRGDNIAKWSIRRRGEEIGYVMQNPNRMISQHLIIEEVGLGLKARKVDPAEITMRVEQVLKVCGLYPYRSWPVSALSYGQKKRLTIASILVLQPKLIILDEPTAGQDYRHYKEFMDFIAQLAEQGTAFLFITHDMYLALEYADRAAVLCGGRMIACGSPASILSDATVTEAAHLRETSLSIFARDNGLEHPEHFVEAFVSHEKRGMSSE